MELSYISILCENFFLVFKLKVCFVCFTLLRYFAPKSQFNQQGSQGVISRAITAHTAVKSQEKRDKFQGSAQSGHVTPLLSCDTPRLPRRLFFHLIWNNIPSVTGIKPIFASNDCFSFFLKYFTVVCNVQTFCAKT